MKQDLEKIPLQTDNKAVLNIFVVTKFDSSINSCVTCEKFLNSDLEVLAVKYL